MYSGSAPSVQWCNAELSAGNCHAEAFRQHSFGRSICAEGQQRLRNLPNSNSRLESRGTGSAAEVHIDQSCLPVHAVPCSLRFSSREHADCRRRLAPPEKHTLRTAASTCPEQGAASVFRSQGSAWVPCIPLLLPRRSIRNLQASNSL